LRAAPTALIGAVAGWAVLALCRIAQRPPWCRRIDKRRHPGEGQDPSIRIREG
jgi:hypothetical protein